MVAGRGELGVYAFVVPLWGGLGTSAPNHPIGFIIVIMP